jgi:hypothetical protein
MQAVSRAIKANVGGNYAISCKNINGIKIGGLMNISAVIK